MASAAVGAERACISTLTNLETLSLPGLPPTLRRISIMEFSTLHLIIVRSQLPRGHGTDAAEPWSSTVTFADSHVRSEDREATVK